MITRCKNFIFSRPYIWVGFFVILLVSSGAANPVVDDRKGIAMAYYYPEDLDRTGSGWFHFWGNCNGDPRCVPMSWCGEKPDLPPDYDGYLILFNEPEVPSQCNITPLHGVEDYKLMMGYFPSAKLVVGNSIFWGYWNDWLYEFMYECNRQGVELPKIWGIHIYISGDASTWLPYIKSELKQLHRDLPGEFWITEFGEVNGNIYTDKAMEDYFKTQDWIKRWSYFTNRAEGTEVWYPSGWNVQLFDWNTGEMTKIGKWYSGLLENDYLPFIFSKK